MTKHKSSPLRSTDRRAIVETLEKSPFLRHNFTVDFDDLKEPAALVQVCYLPNHDYSFEILCYLPNHDHLFKFWKATGNRIEPRYVTMECPGKELGEAIRYERQGFPECLAALESWMQRIVEDCRHASPLFDDLQAFKEAFQQEFAQHLHDAQAHAALGGAPDVQARLEALAQRLEKIEQQSAIQAEKLEQFHTRLSEFAKETNGTAQESWFKPTGTKVVE